MDIYRLADAVFTTQELYEDNAYHPLGEYRDKTIPSRIRQPAPALMFLQSRTFWRKGRSTAFTPAVFLTTVFAARNTFLN